MNPFSQHGQLRWLVWLGIGAALHLVFIVMKWVLFLEVDFSIINPMSYTDHAWFITLAWYLGWLWMWVIE